MDEYLVPTQFGEDEFYEKKSHFIGRAWPVETEEEALEKIQAMKKQHYDATHNCWAYIIKDGAVRFSDDGEPGGTAGMPMIQVLQREGLRRDSFRCRRLGESLYQGRQDRCGCRRQIHEACLVGDVPALSLYLLRAGEAVGGRI